MENQKQKINIVIAEDIASGKYANNAIINFNKTEFIIDFGLFQPQTSNNKIQSRIIINPEVAKSFLVSLQKSVEHFEQSNFTETIGKQTVQ